MTGDYASFRNNRAILAHSTFRLLMAIPFRLLLYVILSLPLIMFLYLRAYLLT